MSNLCRLCSIKEEKKHLSNNEVFLQMNTELYSIEILDYCVKVCSDCRDKTLRFDSHKKAVASKQDIYAELMEMDILAGKERKRLCRFCATMVGEIDVTQLLKLNTFIKDVYDISVNTDEWQLGDYSTAPPAPRRSGSSNSTIIGENNEIDGYRTPTPSNLGTSSCRYI